MEKYTVRPGWQWKGETAHSAFEITRFARAHFGIQIWNKWLPKPERCYTWRHRTLAQCERTLQEYDANAISKQTVAAIALFILAVQRFGADTTQERPRYCSTPGHDREAYLFQLGKLHAAAHAKGLDTDGDNGRQAATAAFFNDATITSWTQLTPAEMRALREAIEDGRFQRESAWQLSPFARRCATAAARESYRIAA